MDIGVGLDSSLNLSFNEQVELSREAARLGYKSIWTPEGIGQDSFQICAQRWAASREIISEGLKTGIAVSPVVYRTPIAFAMSGGTLSELTGGRFVMGIGSGGVHDPAMRHTLGLPKISALSMMRDYLTTLRLLLSGKTVDYTGEVVNLRGVKLNIEPAPRTPIYLGTLGPEMLRLAGELADGAALNWCTTEQVEWSKNRIIEGVERAGREPASVKVIEYIRVSVDDDVELARSALARSIMGYALGPRVPTKRQRQLGYRAHFERMGFTDALNELDELRKRGASQDEIADAFPTDLLLKVGYYGKPEGALGAFRSLAQGLDEAIVRVVAARTDVNSVRAVMAACSPNLINGC